MEVLGLIPARGGSKGIPRKNIALVAGRPLLAYTCDAALGSASLGRVVLSTDDEEIAAVGRQCGVEVPFLRPAQLASDDAPASGVVNQALHWLADNEHYRPDAVVLLQPTSPLRLACHVDEAVAELEGSTADSVVSVVEVPHAYNPVSVMRLKGDRLVPFLAAQGAVITRRQDKPRLYARNGPAVLVSRSGIVARGSLYGETIRPYRMGWPESLDIDTPEDLELAEYYLRHDAKL